MSALSYVVERRIERAKTLMRRTRQPLALIALEAGFTDQSHLTQVFRRATPGDWDDTRSVSRGAGLTPTAYGRFLREYSRKNLP